MDGSERLVGNYQGGKLLEPKVDWQLRKEKKKDMEGNINRTLLEKKKREK